MTYQDRPPIKTTTLPLLSVRSAFEAYEKAERHATAPGPASRRPISALEIGVAMSQLPKNTPVRIGGMTKLLSSMTSQDGERLERGLRGALEERSYGRHANMGKYLSERGGGSGRLHPDVVEANERMIDAYELDDITVGLQRRMGTDEAPSVNAPATSREITQAAFEAHFE